MRKHRSEDYAPALWRVPVTVEDVAETGQHFDLAAGSDVRAAIARLAGLRELPRLEANLDVTRHGAAGLHVTGRVSATVCQDCVVTLEPLANEIEEEVDLIFTPKPVVERQADEAEDHHETRDVKWDDPEPLVGGMVDLGALATEFLILGLDPYPRKPGAMFRPVRDAERDESPFAALANLTKGRNDH